MRAFHRLSAIVALGVLLYLAITGVLIQSLDLHALLTHAPRSDPTMQSIDEGMYGQGNFQVLGVWDLDALALPDALDYPRALETVLHATHLRQPAAEPRLLELRVAAGTVIGQVRIGGDLLAYDASTGDPVPTTNITPTSPPDSLRQSAKELHRFWSHHDTPGVWVELACGVILWAMLITGMLMYFRLLGARWKSRHNAFFWVAGGWWRTLHRGVSLVAAVFLMAIAFSGTWLGFESVAHTFLAPGTGGDASAPLSDDDVHYIAAATLSAFRQSEPQTPIKVLRLRIFGAMKQGVIVTGGATVRQLIFNAETGRRVRLSEPGYPESGFPFGVQVHENIKHFHSGALLGLTARWMDLLSGLALIFLCISGIALYVNAWRMRRIAGRTGLIWL
jgi:uncharacterized iron-regulated membrane protein